MVRDFRKEDYELVCGWWKQHKFPPPPLDLLPATGYIADEAAAAWLYLSNTPVAWLEFTVVDPNAEKAVRHEAIDKLLRNIFARAKAIGNKIIFAAASEPSYCHRLKNMGFIEGDKKVSHFIKGLN